MAQAQAKAVYLIDQSIRAAWATGPERAALLNFEAHHCTDWNAAPTLDTPKVGHLMNDPILLRLGAGEWKSWW